MQNKIPSAHDSNLVNELLSFAGCPNAEQARLNVEQALRLDDVTAEISEVEVDTPELAIAHRFLGSPSVRVSGYDVEEAAQNRRDYGLMCRTYNVGSALAGAPEVHVIRAAIRRALGKDHL
ncbi:MAG: hypothetical protein NVSMB31_05650 [Vulcanimicrobiaceae bacterium]